MIKLFILSKKQLGHLQLGTLVRQIENLPKSREFSEKSRST